MQWGDFQLRLVSDGNLWLDGGAMFGVVPKSLWKRAAECDEENRIRLATNCLLIQTGRQNLLIDTGSGEQFSEKEKRIYRIEHHTRLVSELEKARIEPEEVDVVIGTHLHFDHAGNNTTEENGSLRPTFPNASYVIQESELEAAENPTERNAASYKPGHWRPLKESGQLRLVDGEEEIAPGVTVIPTPGHTPGHQSVLVESRGRRLFYIADLCPTTAHVPLPWIMAYDLHPLTTLETRKRIYPRAVDEEWTIFFEHDPEAPAGILREEGGRYSAEIVELF